MAFVASATAAFCMETNSDVFASRAMPSLPAALAMPFATARAPSSVSRRPSRVDCTNRFDRFVQLSIAWALVESP
eukprot:3192525-Pleurochrysis_carterae.AAC.1